MQHAVALLLMRRHGRKVPWAAIIALASATPAVGSVGFQQVSVPDTHHEAIAVGIWYPSNAQPALRTLGLIRQTVAADGKVSGDRLPLVLISHGTAGGLTSHYDTALALAGAGFVVAAPTHSGDNYADQSYAGNRLDLIDRPRQMAVVLDWVLNSWSARGSVDPRRIGIFGFSLGGFTALVLAGGTPELWRMRQLCSERPRAPECLFVRQRHGDQLDAGSGDPAWRHDMRIKAAVVAAPAAAYLFGPGDLKHVLIPIQLWRAENDESAPDAWNSALVRQELPGSVEEHMVAGAGHFVFLAPCNSGLAAVASSICVDAPGFDRTAFHRDFNESVVQFFVKDLQAR
jgi:predicted dienelactone hydrolase